MPPPLVLYPPPLPVISDQSLTRYEQLKLEGNLLYKIYHLDDPKILFILKLHSQFSLLVPGPNTRFYGRWVCYNGYLSECSRSFRKLSRGAPEDGVRGVRRAHVDFRISCHS